MKHDGKGQLQQELVQLLRNNLYLLTHRPEREHEQEPLADHLECDLELLDEPSAGARDLIAAARWMMTRLSLEERCFLVGLCERMGSLEAGIAKAEALLAIAGTVEEAAWAMEHQDQLGCERRALEDLDRAVNINAILYLIDDRSAGVSPSFNISGRDHRRRGDRPYYSGLFHAAPTSGCS